MKKIGLKAISIMLIILGAYTIFLSVRDMNKPSKESIINGKDISNEEYIYKDELLDIGYTIDEISSIQSKVSLNDVKSYILTNNKFENIVSFVNNPYFNIKNIGRYVSYYKNNPNYSLDQIVLYVELGLDNDFYTHINIVNNYFDVNALVNKYNKLESEVNYEDLVKIPKPYSNDGDKEIRSVAYDSLINMIDAAKKDNIKLFVVSGYRTWKQQERLFNTSKTNNGLEHALMYSAKPGHSEHQLGLAVDLNTTQNGFEKTKQYEWLKQNAYKFGFIERYQKGKEFITGYAFEPWHYRYLGVDIATKIFEENITYEEYLLKYKK